MSQVFMIKQEVVCVFETEKEEIFEPNVQLYICTGCINTFYICPNMTPPSSSDDIHLLFYLAPCPIS